jgi:hypothetical protein
MKKVARVVPNFLVKASRITVHSWVLGVNLKKFRKTDEEENRIE